MAESVAISCSNLMEQNNGVTMESEEVIKTELEVMVKSEPQECLVCVSRAHEVFDVLTTVTAASGSTIHSFLVKFTQVSLNYSQPCSRFVCKTCCDLINVLEHAEVEYLKLKEAFESIISKNPMFDIGSQSSTFNTVKDELVKDGLQYEEDSEDEPLARTKKKRNSKQFKKKKKVSSASKQKVKERSSDKEGWQCDECDMPQYFGGPLELTAHKLAVHTVTDVTNIKVEDAGDVEQSQSPFENGIDDTFGDFDDDDEDSNFNPEDLLIEKKRDKKKLNKTRVRQKKSNSKELHQCDQCSMQYTSLVRLEQHKMKKHDGSKPPYICEVCGAHYKHKRACDIHIQLHKGISDWKCEECNKLFPSKNALQRHNNIHTGKLNYQCDLCGKSFIHTSSFKMHKLSHSGEKPHACDVCGLALMTRSHLKRHKRIHSGEKRHECTVCGKRFSERYNLAAHAKSHDSADAAPASPRRRLFRCHFCAERFERRYMLERHSAHEHGRALERPPPTPRNTMSKLLKAQAQARAPDKERAPPAKLLHAGARLGAGAAGLLAAGSWSGAYAAEFGLRTDFPH